MTIANHHETCMVCHAPVCEHTVAQLAGFVDTNMAINRSEQEEYERRKAAEASLAAALDLLERWHMDDGGVAEFVKRRADTWRFLKANGRGGDHHGK